MEAFPSCSQPSFLTDQDLPAQPLSQQPLTSTSVVDRRKQSPMTSRMISFHLRTPTRTLHKCSESRRETG